MSSQLDAKLQSACVGMLEASGMSQEEAREAFGEMLQKAKNAARVEGTEDLPENFGDLLLQNEAQNPKIRAMLGKARRDGATEDDIRQWWNFHDLERRLIQEVDSALQMGHFLHLRQIGVPAEEAARRVKQNHVYFGDPDDPRLGTGDDRFLPYELKDRINRWRLSQPKSASPSDPTLNAVVRKGIREGSI